MNHFIAGILKIAILEASCALLILDRLLGSGPSAPYPRGRRYAFAAIAGLATYAFFNFGQLRGGGAIVHQWEQFHFYMGAKYLQEVGWFDLYPATVLADRESAGALRGLREIRDVRTFEMVLVEKALEGAERIRRKFSDERWAQFKTDWSYFASRPMNWEAVLHDHGNSNSPAWAIFAQPIARLLPLGHSTQVLIALLDLALMGILGWFAFRTFSVKEAAIGLVVWASLPIVFDYLAGSFLRWDWLFAVGMSLCFLQRGKYLTAGAFLGYAISTKLFPLFFGVALALRAVGVAWRERRLPVRYLRFALGALASLAVAVAVSSALLGTPRAWLDYRDRINAALVEKYYTIQYSLRTVYLQVAESSPAELASHWAFPREIKQARPDVDVRDHRVPLLLVQLAFTLLVAAIALRSDDVSAFALGPLLVFTWLVVNMYYWNMLGLTALGLARRRERPAFFALLGLHLILAVFYLYQHTNHGYAEPYVVSLLLSAGMVAFGAAEAIGAWRARLARAATALGPSGAQGPASGG